MMFFDEVPEQPHNTSDPFRWFVDQVRHARAMQIQAETGWNYVTCKLLALQLTGVSGGVLPAAKRTAMRRDVYV